MNLTADKVRLQEKTKLLYEEQEGDICLLTYQMGHYDFTVHTLKEDALVDMYNAYKCHHAILFCSDDELYKQHLKDIENEEPFYSP